MARPPKVTDEEILSVACRCFLEGGPHIPTSVIAGELGVSEAALYKRFGTKKELMIQACRPPQRPGFLEALEGGPTEGRDVREELMEVASAILDFIRGLMPRIAVIKAAGVSPLEMMDSFPVPPPVLAQRALKAWLDRAMDQGKLVAPDTDALAFVVMGSLHGRAMLTMLAGGMIPDFDRDAYIEQLVDMLLDGVRAPEGGR